ncbi:MAG: hypothetical protein OXT65_11940, partial [Alphaproteobacteria bacterium]|nr:hypothetical protein [Alphaproteobacteria bacterium]
VRHAFAPLSRNYYENIVAEYTYFGKWAGDFFIITLIYKGFFVSQAVVCATVHPDSTPDEIQGVSYA